MPAGVTAYETRPGSRFPPGATVLRDGVNFCVFSRHATRVELLLYPSPDSVEPCQVIGLDPATHRSFFFWHVFVVGLEPGACYTWRVDGPADTRESGRRFNPRKQLVDPWARAVTDTGWDRARAADERDASSVPIRGIVTAPLPARRAQLPPVGLDGAIIYELHVGGFTRHPSSGVHQPGSFAGLIEKIPYLRALGVTHVQLMPVMAFDEQDLPAGARAQGLRNYWGYSTHSFCSPHPRYCVDPARAPREFRQLTDALHRAGIRVLLDVVFNHTAEGGAGGPTINFKGLANELFYHLDPADRRRYLDYTGCGNTVNCNHPMVSTFLVNCLEYWVEQLGVDGFRFDLASVFARDLRGEPVPDPLLPWAIESSRSLARVPVIAEAWDATGLYQVGAFPAMSWVEWNGRYRDVLRRFVRGDPGLVAEVATRIAGSADLYADDGRQPANGVNFITCHDGFTLLDLVSYEHRHNGPNGEDNRDGTTDNASWNCGVEGPTSDPVVRALRVRQAKNFMAVLMLSRGVPMLLAGDEVLRSQRGNNNAYCQDNELSWFDWSLVDTNREMLRFTSGMIALRRRHPCLEANRFFDGRPLPGRDLADITWHGARLDEAPWSDAGGRLLRFTIAGRADGEDDLHVILNMSEEGVALDLPRVAGRVWQLAVDTARGAPQDIVEPALQAPLASQRFAAAARSVVVLEARAGHTPPAAGADP
jgi:glycogen operon protein